GGLVGAVETWATEESVPVNAGRLFRMINDAAALRIDLESAAGQASQLLQSAESGISAAALEGALEALETVRRGSISLQTDALGLTMMPLDTVISTLPQLAKYLAKRVDRDVEVVIEGESTTVDRQLVDRIGEIVRQLVVNAVAHGIETADERESEGKPAHGTVKVALSRNEQHVQIVVADDGAGIDWKKIRELAETRDLIGDDPSTDELRSVLYTPGFSTNPNSSEFTGEGDGLARVTRIVEEVFGTMTLDSTTGRGTTFVVTMPAHRALQSAQIFTAGGRTWGIPDSSVVEVKSIPEVSIAVSERGSFIAHADESIPYSSFSTVVGLDVEGLPSQVMIIQSPTGAIALAVDDVLEVCEVATKDLSPLLAGSSTVVSGVALLGGDDTVMLVDAGRLAEHMREVEVRPEGPVHTVLVVDDSQGVRQVVSGVLASHGFSALVAGSVSDALAILAKNTVDALVVDFSMPRADGVALIHMVRQRYGDIPVVMLSGVANEEDRVRAERAGAHAFFDKADFAKGALVEKLRDLIDGEEGAEAEKAS
ncbi:MAG: response regulator, partial [Acidimicrobiia bacterium]